MTFCRVAFEALNAAVILAAPIAKQHLVAKRRGALRRAPPRKLQIQLESGHFAIQFANDGRMNFRDRDVNGNSFLAGLDFEQGGKLPFRLRANSVRSANIEESQRVSNITIL